MIITGLNQVKVVVIEVSLKVYPGKLESRKTFAELEFVEDKNTGPMGFVCGFCRRQKVLRLINIREQLRIRIRR